MPALSTVANTKILPFEVKNQNMLYAAYMDFIKNGGLFIVTPGRFHLGDSVYVLLTFAETGERFSVNGRVVWITPTGGLARRPSGVGVQFPPEEAHELQKKIEAMLAGHDATQATLTL
ncbi:MAG TPA: PilZ domain-containing protein [Nevskiaceae bacterium]|nr:PilZ domain-containing protein [Nevskiaceae bacterium]